MRRDDGSFCCVTPGFAGDPRWGGSAADRVFASLAQACLEDLLVRDPARATATGDHRFDHRLADLSAEGITELLTTVSRRLGELDGLDDMALGEVPLVDLEILRSRLTATSFRWAELRPHTWDPRVAVPGPSLLPLLDVPTVARRAEPDPDTDTDGAERTRALTSRLSAVPDRLEAARITLRELPRPQLLAARSGLDAVGSRLNATVGPRSISYPDLAAALTAAAEIAAAAMAEHRAWLVAAEPTADRTPTLGPDRYAAALWHTLDSEIGPDTVLARAQADAAELAEDLARAAARLLGRPAGPDCTRDAISRTDAEVPAVLDTAAFTRFVREADLVGLPDPESRWTDAERTHPLPGEPSRGYGGETIYPASWERPLVAASVAAAQQLVPGRALAMLRTADAPSPTRVRHVFPSPVFLAGWQWYAADLLVRNGFPDTADAEGFHVQTLVAQLRLCLATVIDVRTHTEGLPAAAARQLLSQRGHLDSTAAGGLARGALLDPGAHASAYVGWKALAEIVGDLRLLRPDWSERALNDALLGHGLIAPRHLRTLLGLP